MRKRLAVETLLVRVRLAVEEAVMRETRTVPKPIMITHTKRPKWESGYVSPYPTVVMVTIVSLLSRGLGFRFRV